MKKKLFVLLAVIVVLSLVSIPALAGPPKHAEGVWCYLPTETVPVKVRGGNTFMTVRDIGNWTGTFQREAGDCMVPEDGEVLENCAVSDDFGTVVLHSSGRGFYHATVSFVAVTVDGKSGGLEMRITAKKRIGDPVWYGKWVITEGTGDLKDLRGRGTWSGIGWQGDLNKCGALDYSGEYHFDLD